MPYSNLNSDVDKCVVVALLKGDFTVQKTVLIGIKSLSLVYFTLRGC